jgi:peptidoglycan/xylan/chitin deacetylase (PgdA/CDA1 family)
MKYTLLLIACFSCIFSLAQKKTVVLTFDDAIASHYTVAGPLLKSYGFGATFYVSEFPPDFSDSSKYLNWRQISDLSKMGFEIGNHTWHHTVVTNADTATLEKEIAYIEDKCVELGIPKPVNFAYPGYDVSEASVTLLKKRGYRSARTCEGKAHEPGKDDPFYLPAYGIAGNDTTTFYNALKNQKGNEIIIFLFHGVPDNAYSRVNTPEDIFRRYMAYLYHKGYKVLALKEVVK